jgi:hypothetical protein
MSALAAVTALWLLSGPLLLPAAAAPVGLPVPDPSIGRVVLTARGDVENVRSYDMQCVRPESCETTWKAGNLGGELDLSLLRGLGVVAEAGHQTGAVAEADYAGEGSAYGLGLRAALPVGRSRWWLAGLGKVGWSKGVGDPAEQGGLERDSLKQGTVSLVGAYGDPGDGLVGWVGGQGAFWWYHNVQPLGESGGTAPLDVWLLPQRPVSFVTGGSLISESLGAAWGPGVRAVVSAELRIGQGTGLTAWAGVAF